MTWLEIILTVVLVLTFAIQTPWLIRSKRVLKRIYRICSIKKVRLENENGNLYVYFDDENRTTLLSRRGLDNAYIRAVKIEESKTYNVPELIENHDMALTSHVAGGWK